VSLPTTATAKRVRRAGRNALRPTAHSPYATFNVSEAGRRARTAWRTRNGRIGRALAQAMADRIAAAAGDEDALVVGARAAARAAAVAASVVLFAFLVIAGAVVGQLLLRG